MSEGSQEQPQGSQEPPKPGRKRTPRKSSGERRRPDGGASGASAAGDAGAMEKEAPPEVEAEPFDPARDPGPTYDVPRSERAGAAPSTLWPTLCHLSPLLGWLLASTGVGFFLMPFVWIAAPLIVWRSQRSDPAVDDQGREAVNFQINVAGLTLVLVVSCIGVLLVPLLWAASLVLSLIGAVRASEGKRYRYPWIYRAVRS